MVASKIHYHLHSTKKFEDHIIIDFNKLSRASRRTRSRRLPHLTLLCRPAAALGRPPLLAAQICERERKRERESEGMGEIIREREIERERRLRKGVLFLCGCYQLCPRKKREGEWERNQEKRRERDRVSENDKFFPHLFPSYIYIL